LRSELHFSIANPLDRRERVSQKMNGPVNADVMRW
jgi:hypothetical protein